MNTALPNDNFSSQIIPHSLINRLRAMLGFDSDNEEHSFHQMIAWTILYLSPLVAFLLMGFRLPTYGKHVTISKGKEKSSGDHHASGSSATGDATLKSESMNTSTPLLRQRRVSSNNESTPSQTMRVASGAGDGDNHQQKEKIHWLGPKLPARWSWLFMESPTWVWVLVCLWDFYGNREDAVEERTVLPLRNQILLGWFTFHYLYRSLWYPLVMMKVTSARMPFGVVMMAWSYCSVNGYLQARDLTKFSLMAGGERSLSSENNFQFWLGILIIVSGFSINFTSDRILQRIKQEKQRKLELRKSRQSGDSRKKQVKEASSRYAVPYGGFFEYVSSPHYFGEFTEWAGFCIANDFSLASVSFVVWTGANLIPRAIQTHKWYIETFDGSTSEENDDGDDSDRKTITDYSKLNRKAVIPFIL